MAKTTMGRLLEVAGHVMSLDRKGKLHIAEMLARDLKDGKPERKPATKKGVSGGEGTG